MSVAAWVVDRRGWIWESVARAVASRAARHKHLLFAAQELQSPASGVDVAMVLWWKAAEDALRLFPGARIVTCFRDHLTWVRESNDMYLGGILGISDIVTAATEDLASELAHKMPQGRSVAVLEGGVDCQRFVVSRLPERFVVGWAGNSARRGDPKGLRLIEQACRDEGIELDVVDGGRGSGIPASEMPDWYRGISVLACASESECAPNPVLEAMASGRPVVSTRVGLVPCLVDQRCGRIVDRTAEALRCALRELRDMPPSTLERMGAAARASVARFDWDIKAETWGEMIDRAAAMPAKAYPFTVLLPQVTPISESHGSLDISRIQWVEPEPSQGKPHGLLTADQRGWAFAGFARDTGIYLPEFQFQTAIAGEFPVGWPDPKRFDFVFLPYLRWPINDYMPWDRMLGALRSSYFRPTPGPPTKRDIALVNRFRAFQVVRRANYEELAPHCPNVMYLTNPVDTRRFNTRTEAEGLIAAWAGNTGRSGPQDQKGYHSVIVPAVEAAGWKLEVAEFTRRLPPEEMPGFWRRATVSICASAYEGACRSVMESMACGLAVLSTDVGNMREMHESMLDHFGESGIEILPREPGAFADALRRLAADPGRVRAMGDANRAEVQARWSWTSWRARFAEFFRAGLRRTP